MATKFQRTETITTSVEIRDENGVLQDPSTSTEVRITHIRTGTVVQVFTAMTKDAVGKFSFNHDSGATDDLGLYQVRYKAVDGTRTTLQDDEFELEA